MSSREKAAEVCVEEHHQIYPSLVGKAQVEDVQSGGCNNCTNIHDRIICRTRPRKDIGGKYHVVLPVFNGRPSAGRPVCSACL